MVSRKAYQTVVSTGDDLSLSTQGKALFRFISDYYELDPSVTGVDPFVLTARIQQELPQNYQRLTDLLDSLDPDPAVENFREMVKEQRKHGLREQMAMALIDKKDDVAANLWREITDLDEIEEDVPDEFVGSDVHELLAVVESGNRIPFPTAELRNATRGLSLIHI